MATEEVICQILANLFACDVPELRQICTKLKVAEPDVTASKMLIVASIKDYLTTGEIKESPDGGLQLYQQVLALVVKKDKGEDFAKKFNALEEEMTNKVKNLELQLETTTKAAWRRELRIAGQIGESGQKDKLSFTSLARQMEAAVNDNRTETEIIEAILKAMSPGLRLRSYLEGTANLTLGKLRRLLRAHYQEKDATTLFHELSGAAQPNGETPQNYLIRLLDMRQKIIFASQEDNSGLAYNPELVQKMLTKSFCTGLQGLTIRSKMENLLAEGKVSDEVLMEQLNAAVATESEIKIKRAAVGRQSAKLQEVEASTPPKPTSSDLLKSSILKELKEDIQTFLKAEVNAAFGQQQQQSQPRRQYQPQPPQQQRPRGCQACQSEGVGSSCQHCFKCGSRNHYARGCRAPRTSGNDNGLQRGDNLQSYQRQ